MQDSVTGMKKRSKKRNRSRYMEGSVLGGLSGGRAERRRVGWNKKVVGQERESIEPTLPLRYKKDRARDEPNHRFGPR